MDVNLKHLGIGVVVKNNGKFYATVDDVELVADNFDAMKQKIVHATTDAQKKIKVALPVIGLLEAERWSEDEDMDGEVGTGTFIGINRTTRELQVTGLPKGYRLDKDTVIADTPGNRELLNEFIDARQKLDDLQATVSELKLWKGSDYGRIDAGDYDNLITGITMRYEAQMNTQKAR